MNFAKALICVDFSEPSKKLIDSIPDLKKVGLKEVVLASVINVHPADENVPFIKETYSEKRQLTLERLEELSALAKTHGVETKEIVSFGFTGKELLNIAVQEQADLIVVGSHGKGVVKTILLGSTSFELARKSEIPVLIEKFKDVERDQFDLVSSEKFKKVVLPVDFSLSSLKVVDFVKDKDFIKDVILVKVVARGENIEDLDKRTKEIQEKLENIKKELTEAGKNVEIRLKQGTPAEKIMEIAETDNASLIMISKGGAGNIAELLIGSTAIDIARYSKIPVLLFPKFI